MRIPFSGRHGHTPDSTTIFNSQLLHKSTRSLQVQQIQFADWSEVVGWALGSWGVTLRYPSSRAKNNFSDEKGGKDASWLIYWYKSWWSVIFYDLKGQWKKLLVTSSNHAQHRNMNSNVKIGHCLKFTHHSNVLNATIASIHLLLCCWDPQPFRKPRPLTDLADGEGRRINDPQRNSFFRGLSWLLVPQSQKLKPSEVRIFHYDIPLCWVVYRDPYIGLLSSQ